MKTFLQCFTCVSLLVITNSSNAQSNQISSYPNRPVRILVGSAPGGGSDITTRLVAPKISESLGVPVVVENRSAGAIYGLDAASRATPDGYTIAFAASGGYSAAVLAIKLPFNIKTAIDPLVQLTSQSYIVAATPSVPFKSVKELIEYAKTNPGTLNYASSGSGSAGHLGMELFNVMAGVKTTHIPYKGGGPAIVDLMSGTVQLFIVSTTTVSPYLSSGKLKALAVADEKRHHQFPNLPTVRESGLKDYELSGWYGLIAPSGLPAPIIAKIHQSVTRALRDQDVQKKISAGGSDVVLSKSPAEFRQVVLKEIAKWEKFRQATGINLELN